MNRRKPKVIVVIDDGTGSKFGFQCPEHGFIRYNSHAYAMSNAQRCYRMHWPEHA